MTPQTQTKAEPRLKDHIPESVRTPGKDDAAEKIREIVDAGRWPMDLQDIAEESDWSRQHIANTIQAYFEFPGETESKNENGEAVRALKRTPDRLATDVVHLEMPADIVEPEEYVRGWFAGWLSRDDDVDQT